MEDEIWQPVPVELVGKDGYYASNYYRLKFHDILVKPSKGSEGTKGGQYKITNINGHTQYFHRMMYFAFHPEHINLGRVVIRDLQGVKLDSSNVFDIKLDDLLFQMSKPVDHGDEITDGQYIHPIYGQYQVNGWFPVKCYVRDTLTKFDKYELRLTTNPEFPCKIRSKYNNLILKYSYQTDTMMTLTERGNKSKLLLTHIMLATVFPDVPRNESVDHIDNHHGNNHINNLQWLSRSDNSIKNGVNQGASKVNLSRRVDNEIIESEEWTKFHNYEVSDKGRIRRKGKILLGAEIRGKKYRTVLLSVTGLPKKKRHYIHHIVWRAFKGDIPEGMDVLHDDSAPLQDGLYRNWLIDLSIGSRKQNMLDYHAQKRITLAS